MTFDADGNTLTDSAGRVNVWDSQNRLVSCTKGGVTSTFTYGADGLRRTSTVNGVTTYYAYDGQTLVQEMKSSQGVPKHLTTTYLQGTRGTECRIDETQQTEGYYHYDPSNDNEAFRDPTTHQPIVFARGVSHWYIYDGLGSVTGEVDVNGHVTSSPKYDVYGAVRSNSGTASSRQGFVGALGHISDTETGLIYMRARYYDPGLGRFSSEDPSKNGTNWFAYANNNPTNIVDATGRDAEWAIELLARMLITYVDNAYNTDIGYGTDTFKAALEQLRATIDAGKAEANANAVAGTIKANSPAAVADESGSQAASGSIQAEGGLAQKAVGAITEEQIDIIEAWLDRVN